MEIDIKNKEKTGKLVTILLVGVLVLVIAIPAGKETDRTTDNDKADYISYADYYEEKLKAILENSYGEGTMEVMVHLSGDKQTDSFYNSDSMTDIVDGVLVVADVTDAQAVSDISFAVCALFDLPAHKVAVLIKK